MCLNQILKFIFADKPVLYKFFIRTFNRHKSHLIISSNTELVIDGFPRSANTFSVVAFELSQYRSVNIAHHTHAPATIIEGCRRNLPVVLLIRDALSSVSSAAVFTGAQPFSLLNEWVWFYKSCLPFKDKLIVASFDQVIKDYDNIITKINKNFNLNYRPFYNDENMLASVKNRIERIAKKHNQSDYQVAWPSECRDELKQKIKNVLLKHKYLLATADQLLTQYIAV